MKTWRLTSSVSTGMAPSWLGGGGGGGGEECDRGDEQVWYGDIPLLLPIQLWYYVSAKGSLYSEEIEPVSKREKPVKFMIAHTEAHLTATIFC